MTTEIVCTVCGARQPLIAALDAATVRGAWTAALALAGGADIAPDVVAYVDWFAAPDKAPQARTVVRVLEDLTRRIQAGTVLQQCQARPAPLALWLEAMRLVVSGQTQATRPLKNNAYLAGIVWHRAGTARPLPAAAPVSDGPPAAGSDPAPNPALQRSHLLNELAGLKVLLGGTTGAGAAILQQQIDHLQGRLAESAGENHGSGV